MKKEIKTVAAILPESKEVYEAPVIHSIEVRVEQGFQETTGLAVPGETDSTEYTW